ncbi:Eco57I restriction-modification methylase domain-containing protein [Stygiobacter electus]|uniref:site-specific DNA-methyltransferase (adenine-specific) n=1 Tax=Stygiobacter electus TaxID=3032292 RepID=A0AAE3P268_9BACT|nr:N-6 DNA methylase [Stygiobacter electus]MDF1612890.1 Eco57I restriction-modification methylase domain-containing protein [Stygiobacter electus]
MTKPEAKNLVAKTFEDSFDESRFTYFVKNLLNNLDESKTKTWTGNYIPEAFRNAIKSYKRIGQYTDNDKIVLDILCVNVKRDITLERARTLQRNFIARHLKQRNHEAALVAFYTEGYDDWRFSLVKLDFNLKKTKVEIELSPAKRYSFLVGVNERSHTAQSQFQKILTEIPNPSLNELEHAFNIETVTKEFFFEYRNLFIRTKLELDKILKNDSKLKAEFDSKNVNSVDFSKKLLGQIIFLYFLQKKGWFGVERDSDWGTGSKKFLRELLDRKHGDYNNFFNDILEPLFYEALRYDRQDYYYSRFNCKIPFLNGGLFDPINNYDWVHTDIILPNELFSNKNRTPQGDIGDGIFDIFDRYNFTVIEDEPLEKEVAIDPELLGKAYEKFNAIRPDNFDEYLKALKSENKGEENKFNKQYGVYYTPREIVHYMCRESLINYLASEFNLADGISTNITENNSKPLIPKEDFEILINYGELLGENDAIVESRGKETETYYYKLPESIRKNSKLIDEKLADILICDPAVGSGAFPVGMMHEIVSTRNLLSTFIKDKNRSIYNFKRECIEKSLYGVDIDSGAVEIAKLRLWLSLVVDEEDFKEIKPLPNLDYKIVCGNSLLGVQKDLLNAHLFDELEKLKPLHFNETNPTKKQEYKNKIEELILKLSNGHKDFDFEVYFSEVFHHKNGFDIVIGNPPYVQLQKNGGSLAKQFENQNYNTFTRTGDIYTLFYEKGINILRNSGQLIFITSNKWMRAGYGEKLRVFFTKYNPVLLIDLGPGIFENATVDTNILLLQKTKNQNQLKAVTLQKNDSVDIVQQLNQNGVTLNKLNKDAWFIGSSAEQQLKEKIELIGKPLKDWDVKIYRGVLTGLNEAFIITTESRNEILANCKDEDERQRTEAIIKPILRGRDIKRYHYEWAGLWVIGTFPTLKLNIDDYSALKKYFLDNFDIKQLEQSGKKYPSLGFNARKKTGNKWFETQDQIAYYPEFEKEKVVWKRIGSVIRFALDVNKTYPLDSNVVLTGKHVKYLCGFLNSKLSIKQLLENSPKTGTGDVIISVQALEPHKIPPITPSNEHIVRQIESLVDKILAAKKQNPQSDTSHLERVIDQLVYKLYGLTEEEIGIIENKK